MEFADEQASSRVVLEEGTPNERVLTKCDQCREMWRERNERGVEGEPNCGECWVDLMEENRDAAHIYQLCRRQVITAGEANEVIDLNYQTLKTMMDLYGVRDQRECFERITQTFHHFLKKEKDARN